MPAAIRLGLTSHHRTGGIGVTDFMAFASIAVGASREVSPDCFSVAQGTIPGLMDSLCEVSLGLIDYINSTYRGNNNVLTDEQTLIRQECFRKHQHRFV